MRIIECVLAPNDVAYAVILGDSTLKESSKV